MTQASASELGALASPGIGEGWWRTVTTEELYWASGIVQEFMSSAAPVPDDVERFSRALALQQLLGESEVVLEAATHAYHMAQALEQAEAWPLKAELICSALLRCLELLGATATIEQHRAVMALKMSLHIAPVALSAAAKRGQQYESLASQSKRRSMKL